MLRFALTFVQPLSQFPYSRSRTVSPSLSIPLCALHTAFKERSFVSWMCVDLFRIVSFYFFRMHFFSSLRGRLRQMPLLFHTTTIANKAIKIDNSAETLYRFLTVQISLIRSLSCHHTTCIFLARKPNSNPRDPEAALVKFSKKTQEVEPKPLYVNGDYQRLKKKLWNIHIMYRICSTLGCLPWFFSSHRSSALSLAGCLACIPNRDFIVGRWVFVLFTIIK